jgi:hypothetical protein
MCNSLTGFCLVFVPRTGFSLAPLIRTALLAVWPDDRDTLVDRATGREGIRP